MYFYLYYIPLENGCGVREMLIDIVIPAGTTNSPVCVGIPNSSDTTFLVLTHVVTRGIVLTGNTVTVATINGKQQ